MAVLRPILALALSAVPSLAAQTTSSTLPMAWIQLRGGTDNTGRAAGSLAVTWAYNAHRPIRGLAAASGVIVVGTESRDADAAPNAFSADQRGFVVALDAATGAPRWTRAMSSWIHGDPLIFRDRVIVTYGRWPMTHLGGITALSLATGQPLWTLGLDAGAMPSAVIDTATHALFVIGGDGVLYTIDALTGAVRDRRGLRAADAMSSPRIDKHHTLFFGTADALRRLPEDSSGAGWTFRPAALRALGDIPVALADSFVFTTGTRLFGFWNAARALPVTRLAVLLNEARRTKPLSGYAGWFSEQWLLAVDRETGRLRWKQPLGVGLEVPRNTSGTPVLVGDAVVVSSPVSRTIWAFDAATGQIRWRHDLRAVHKGALTVIDDDLVLGDKRGNLLFLDARNGRQIGECRAGDAFTAFAPILVGSTLFVATHDGWLHAVTFETVRRHAIARQGCF
jgi:outer membrane protein assembly factor BamB